MRWTPQEKDIINRAVLDGTKARDLEALLPGRKRPQIQCQLASARKRLKDGRGQWVDPVAQAADQNAAMAQGVCRWCRSRFADHTLISCERCSKSRGTGNAVEEMDVTKTQADMLPWIFSRHPGQLVSWLPAAKKVVDPFGGSGRIARAAVRRDKKVVFNDLHPLLSPYVRALAQRKHDDINLLAADLALDSSKFPEHYREIFADPFDDVMAAATVRLAAFNSRSCHLDRVKQISFAPRVTYASDSRLWQKMDTETRDWKEVIRDHDSRHVSFVLDPPYPKTDYYEHNLDWMGFKDLVEVLAGIQGKFLMVLPTRRDIIELCHKHEMFAWMRRVKMYKGAGRDLVVANYPISDTSLDPVEATRYGLTRSEAQVELVEDVIEGLQKLGGIGTRREIGERIGNVTSDLLGAIARARAEGRVEKYDKRRYCLPDAKEQPIKAIAISCPPMPVAKPKPIEAELVEEPEEDPIVQVITELDHAHQDEQPFKIYANRDKIIGDVGDFIASMNSLGYEVVFRTEEATW